MSEHDLEEEQSDTHSLLSKWIVQVYFHQFSNIKARPRIVNGPHHRLTHLRLIRDQDQIVRDIVTPYIRSEA